jgi:3-oxoacyl-[acyl-carrier protein] reductase
MRLDGKVAVVTGGARGIGQGIANVLADAGARIVVGDILDPTATAEQIQAKGKEAMAMRVDVADRSQVNDLIALACEEYGHIDVLVNNAGIDVPEGDIRDLPDDDWQRVIDVNLSGVFYCSQAAIARMVDQGSGAIVNMSSHLAWMGAPGISPAYNASKAGVLGLTMSLATQVGPLGVRVNAIAPGLIRSRDFGWSPEEDARRVGEYALGAGEPADIGEAVRFLASPAAKWITGTVLYMHGGHRRSSPWS